MEDGKFVSIKVEEGANGDIHKVDGISGGTITSDGVSDMIDERLSKYHHISKVFQLKIKF